jgi:large subunit ribosomal protein L6|tara:strand:- start:213 stop:767 length:555 start_codon:yes stop_codon:yes gene_type:complete
MSYIGRLPIKVPEEVQVFIAEDNKSVVVKGPHGELKSTDIAGISYHINPEGSALHVSLEDKKYKRFWGLARTLVSNNIIGVSRQFSVKLEFVGVGYRVSVLKTDDSVLELQLGFSHDILLNIPQGIIVECKSKKNTSVVLLGNNKDLLSKFASKIRNYRPPEPYKGKGVKFANESVRRKEGKKK